MIVAIKPKFFTFIYFYFFCHLAIVFGCGGRPLNIVENEYALYCNHFEDCKPTEGIVNENKDFPQSVKSVNESHKCLNSAICSFSEDAVVKAELVQRIAFGLLNTNKELSEENCGELRDNRPKMIAILQNWGIYLKENMKTIAHQDYENVQAPWMDASAIIKRLEMTLRENNFHLNNLIIICDISGTLQSIGTIQDQPFWYKNEKVGEVDSKNYLEIEYLATSPHNLKNSIQTQTVTRGAGRKFIERAIVKSKIRGYQGRIFVKSLRHARFFYRDNGFKLLFNDEDDLFGFARIDH